ncbi:MAG: bifunctional indole-3-glycerol-phosphate synthase TrpC/phosphoribosylanthranilate isomerase TrpF [Ktedonobacteraceae bacterium]
MFLDRIVAQTRIDLEQRKRERSLDEMMRLAVAQSPPRDLLETIRPGGSKSQVRLIAEVKRASPSKGLLAPHLDPVELARTYEANGAAAISVLTEPHFFLGSPEYLTAIKQAVNIPVLRKDFIVDEYQIYEARAWGADAILLICAILDDQQLRHLLKVAHDQRMRCLVEVHNAGETRRAVAAGAVVIGINSRDLVTFQMHPSLIRELRQLIPPGRVVVAESGIHTAADARRLARYDVQAMLVGESLVKSNNVAAQVHSLLQAANESVQVKICGLRTQKHLNAAIDAGADMLGFVFYEPSHRYVEPSQALLQSSPEQSLPDLVGVFVNKDADFINDVAEEVGLHFVQLHGHESPEFCQRIKRPVLKALHLHTREDKGMIKAYRETAWRILLDTPTAAWGGTGVTHDWSLARSVAQEIPIMLAGGLTPENAIEAISQVRPWGVDVSSGVETNKHKDETKIRTFIENVRKAL